MTTIQEARQALADAVSTLPDVTCVARPVPGNTRPGDGWVTVGRVAPGQFIGSRLLTLSAFVVLGSDERLADQKIDELSVPLLEATYPLFGISPSVEPQIITAGEAVPGNIYALALSVTIEIS